MIRSLMMAARQLERGVTASVTIIHVNDVIQKHYMTHDILKLKLLI